MSDGKVKKIGDLPPAPALSGLEASLTILEKTALGGAAFRTLDAEQSGENRLFEDPLAKALAGVSGMHSGSFIMRVTTDPAKQGGNNYWAARAFLVDRDIQQQLQALKQRFSGVPKTQVVNIGCGMDTRPWRLNVHGVAWFDVDRPNVIQLKTELLAKAGAQTQPGSDTQAAAAYPLLCDSYHALGCTLSADGEDAGMSLESVLTAASTGFDPELPTLFVMEGLSYYLDIATVSKVFTDMANLAPAGSVALVTTCTQDVRGVWRARAAALRAAGQEVTGVLDFKTPIGEFITGGGRSPDSPCLVHDLGWSVAHVTPDYRDYLPQVVPGHFTYPPYPKILATTYHKDCDAIDVECTAVLVRQ